MEGETTKERLEPYNLLERYAGHPLLDVVILNDFLADAEAVYETFRYYDDPQLIELAKKAKEILDMEITVEDINA